MANRPKIGVVTVTYNSAEVLPEFLSCTFAQSFENFILYAVDNASTDSTLEVLRACVDPRLKIIPNSDNRGVAEGNNQGIRAGLADGCGLVLLLNNDTAFDANLFEGLLNGLDKHHCDMVCPKMLYYSEPNRIWAAGGRFRPWLGYTSTHYGEGELDHGQFDTARRVTYVPTCCVLVRSEVFSSVGLMDARYFVYCDDSDFMYRAMKAGKILMYLPHLRLLHKVGHVTGGEESSFSVHYGTRNRLFFLIKHFGLLRVLPWMVVCQVFWTAELLFTHKGMEWFRWKQKAFCASLRIPGMKNTPLREQAVPVSFR